MLGATLSLMAAVTRAVVLAAGLGSRLAPLSDQLPKPAMPVLGVPMITRALTWLQREGITEAVVNAFHLPDKLIESVQATAPPGLDIVFSVETELLGTSGGIARASALLAPSPTPLLVVNADVLFETSLSAVARVHGDQDAFCTLVLRHDETDRRSGSVEVDGSGRVQRLRGQGMPGLLSARIFTGVRLLSEGAVARLSVRGDMVEEDLLPWIREGRHVASLTVSDSFSDLGTPRDYGEANLALLAAGYGGDSWIHPEAKLAPGARVARSVIDARAKLATSAALEECIVWPDTYVAGRHRRTILTPAGATPF